jgi:ABC-2 type transport system ATP-binding protein
MTIRQPETIISIRDVSKHFKDVKAVNHISLEIKQGVFLALLGPNGAGKTTLVEMIEGLQHPDAGEITILGKKWEHAKSFLNRHLGISLQETRFIDKLTTTETLCLFASFYDLPRKRVEEVIHLVGLEEKRKAYTVNLSGGQRQRLALGIALLNNPGILLLDEPTTGLDPNSRRELWKLLTDLKKSHNTTLVLTTHYMEEAAFLCDEIVIMDKGKILAQGSLEKLLSDYSIGEIIEFSLRENYVSFDFEPGDPVRALQWDAQTGRGNLIVNEIVTIVPSFMKYIQQKDFHLTSFVCRKMTLEDLFIGLTGRKLDE